MSDTGSGSNGEAQHEQQRRSSRSLVIRAVIAVIAVHFAVFRVLADLSPEPVGGSAPESAGSPPSAPVQVTATTSTEPVPNACSRFSANSAHATPAERFRVAREIDDHIDRVEYRPGRAVFEPPASLVLTNMSECNANVVRNVLVGDYSLPLFLRRMCTSVGFVEVRCDTAAQRGAYVLDLERGCRCSDQWSCRCPEL